MHSSSQATGVPRSTQLLTAGLMTLLLVVATPVAASKVNYGDDASEYANDGECDDLRFVGPGMEGVTLLADDVMHDATDCRKLVEAGKIRYGGDDPLDFGDDSGDFARDGECDDPRFEGVGMTETALLAQDIKADATDCRRAWKKGLLKLR